MRVVAPMMTGTNNQPVYFGGEYEDAGPAAFRPNGRRAQLDALKSTGMDEFDIPAFLRKQAD
jgi:cell division protein FtsZ